MSKKERLCPYGPTNTYIIDSPIGQLKLTSCLKGIHSLGMLGDITDENFRPDTKVSVSLVGQLYQDNGYMYNPAIEGIAWLEAFFKDEPQKTESHPKICKYVGKTGVSDCPEVAKKFLYSKLKCGLRDACIGSFTNKVWFTLQKKVPYGRTISYQSLGKLCDSPKACRAVGQAMRNNPVMLIIPCHRVINESGSLGNYHYGTRNKVKEWLLHHEHAIKK